MLRIIMLGLLTLGTLTINAEIHKGLPRRVYIESAYIDINEGIIKKFPGDGYADGRSNNVLWVDRVNHRFVATKYFNDSDQIDLSLPEAAAIFPEYNLDEVHYLGGN